MVDLSGHELGGVRLIRPIGLGGMGEVYLGEQTRLGNRAVAVKVVRLESGALSPDILAELERRFTREATLLGSFSHPNILPVYDAGVEDGLLYMVMAYVADGSLADAVRPGPEQKLPLPLAPGLAADLIGQVGAALQYTHDRGVVHRDVKPGNILVRQTTTGQWQLLLADFGVAKAMAETGQKTQVTGTFAYMAPEQFTGAFSPASDQYALGVVAFQLLAGRTPFAGDLATVTQAHLNTPPPSVRTFNPAISPRLDAVIRRALAKRPADRYPSVAAFTQALHDAASVLDGERVGGAALPAAVSWPLAGPNGGESRRPSLARAWVAVLAALVLLVGGVGGAGLLRSHNDQLAAQATQTAQAAATSGAGSTTNTAATQTAVAVVLTATAAAYIPTATATAGLGTDVTSPPPAPDAAGALALADAAPTCHGSNPPWVTALSTMVSCQSGGVEIRAQSAGTLGCIEQHGVPSDAYISVLVTDAGSDTTKGPVVAFRQGTAPAGTATPAGNLAGVGYYFGLIRADATYNVYQFDSATHSTTLSQGTLATGPAAHYALGVLVKGNQITLYVNGQPIAGPLTDTTHASGWVSLCTTGDTLFRDFQVYTLKP